MLFSIKRPLDEGKKSIPSDLSSFKKNKKRRTLYILESMSLLAVTFTDGFPRVMTGFPQTI